MEELLKRWAELEPARCRIELLESVWCCGMDRFLIGAEIDAVFVQCAVQEAIEARGLFWSVGQRRSGKTWLVHYVALVADDPAELRTKLSHGGISDTPAAALLTAYIAALEALNA